MFELFTEETTQQYSVLRWPEFDYIKRSYTRELLNVEDYYHNRTYAVKSNHLLASILYHLNVPMQYPADRYVEVVRTRAPYVANAIKLTSELQYGKIHAGVFYGPGCDEILISNDEYFDPYFASVNWKSINAVQPLLHPKTDLKLLLPNGKDMSTDHGLAVLAINIPLLALQYRCFVMDQAARMNDSSLLGIAHFIQMYVLPNMLYKHLDLAIMNRLMHLFNGEPMGITHFKHPFNIINYSAKLDTVLVKTIDRLAETPMPYAAMLMHIPGVTSEDASQYLQLPDYPPTRQLHWAMVISRLAIIRCMVNLGGDRGISRNRLEIGILQRILKRLDREQMLASLLPQDIYYDIKLDIDYLLAI